MRILQIIPYFYLSWSKDRPVELIHELSKSLINRGHEVTIYTSDVFSNNGNSISHLDQIEIHEFISNSGHPLCVSFNLAKALNNNINKFDVIHLHEYRTFPNLVAHHCAKKYKKPYVLQAHGSLPIEIGRKGFKRIFDLALGSKLLNDASRVIALTETELSQYASMGVDRERIEIIPNGIDNNEFAILPERGKFKRKYSFDQETKLILFIGRLDETKGIDILIEAFAILKKDLDNIKLVIIGKDYGFKETLFDLSHKLDIAENVIFTGFLSNAEKDAAFVDSEVFVTPRYYGFPHTFLEALAHGVPIITTTSGDRLDWIEDNVGWITDFSPEKLKDTLLIALNENGLRQIYSSRCRKIARDYFDWSVIAAKLEHLYKDIAQ
jgi:glycosyltransferase involved in cell wall biosynthesis